MAAEYLRTLVNDVDVISAGLNAKPGKPADPRAVQLAPTFGVSLASHRATLLDADLIDHTDAIFVMDRINEAKLLAAFPQAAAKLHLLGAPDEFWIHTPARLTMFACVTNNLLTASGRLLPNYVSPTSTFSCIQQLTSLATRFLRK